MARTKVTQAPYDKDGNLLHYPGDGMGFSHFESDAGERLEASDIWEEVPASMDDYGRWVRPIRIEKRTDYRRIDHEVDWRPNEPFYLELKIAHMLRGRSAKYLVLKPFRPFEPERTYPMFVADLIDVAQRQGIASGGVMSGWWMVSQRGQNYGLRLAKEEE